MEVCVVETSSFSLNFHLKIAPALSNDAIAYNRNHLKLQKLNAITMERAAFSKRMKRMRFTQKQQQTNQI